MTRVAAAITAPVLPAEKNASALPSLTSLAPDHDRRVLLGSYRRDGVLVHLDDLGADDRLNALSVLSSEGLDHLGRSREHDAESGVFRERSGDSGQYLARSVVPADRVDCDRYRTTF